MANIPELKNPGAAPAKQEAKPVNDKCPVDGNGDVKPQISINIKGKIVAFCQRACYNKFLPNAAQYIATMPELGGKKPDPNKPEAKPGDTAKPDAKPAASGACDCKTIDKGPYCVSCKRELTMDDVKGRGENIVCKRCETKPISIDYCVKRLPPIFQADCHPNKTDTKPVS